MILDAVTGMSFIFREILNRTFQQFSQYCIQAWGISLRRRDVARISRPSKVSSVYSDKTWKVWNQNILGCGCSKLVSTTMLGIHWRKDSFTRRKSRFDYSRGHSKKACSTLLGCGSLDYQRQLLLLHRSHRFSSRKSNYLRRHYKTKSKRIASRSQVNKE